MLSLQYLMQSESSTVFCKLELHVVRRETVLKIYVNLALKLTILLETGPSSRTLKILVLS